MISYYELLGMIKEGKAPSKIKVHLTSEPRIYKRDDDIEEYCYYVLNNKDEENDDYKYYLMESYMESMIFDENIEILDKEKIEKLEYVVRDKDGDFTIDGYAMDYEQKIEIIKKINEIIDYLNSKGE